MNLKVEREAGVLYCVPAGRVDVDTAWAFRDGVLGELANEDYEDQVLVIDLQGVEYVSSSGLQAFLMVSSQAVAKSVRFGVCGLQEGVMQVFRASGFDRALRVFGSRDEARAGLTGF